MSCETLSEEDMRRNVLMLQSLLLVVVALLATGAIAIPNCTLPLLDTACNGMELVLENCDLLSPLIIKLPSNVTVLAGGGTCANIAITVRNVSFIQSRLYERAMVMFSVPNGDYRNISVSVDASLIRGNVVLWRQAVANIQHIANVSLYISNTSVSEGQGLTIVGARNCSGTLEFVLRNVRWRFEDPQSGCEASVYCSLSLFAFDKDSATVVSTLSNVIVLMDHVTLQVAHYIRSSDDAKAIYIYSTNVTGRVDVIAIDSTFEWVVTMSTAGDLSTAYTDLVHLWVEVLHDCSFLLRNVSTEVVHYNSSSTVVHEVAVFAVLSASRLPRRAGLSLLTRSLRLKGNISLRVEGSSIHLQGTGRSSLFAVTSAMASVGVSVMITVVKSVLRLINKGNVSTLTLGMIRNKTPGLNTAFGRQATIVELRLAEFLDRVDIEINDCAVTLTVVVDSSPSKFATNPIFDDSVAAFEANGVLLSNASNVSVRFWNCVVEGGVMRLSVATPYVTIGCYHQCALIALGGSVTRVMSVSVVNTTATFIDNVSYTAPNPLVVLQSPGLGSVSINMALVVASVAFAPPTTTFIPRSVVLDNCSANFDVATTQYFTNAQLGGVTVALVTAAPQSYFLQRRGEIPVLLQSVLEALDERITHAFFWEVIDIRLNHSSFSFAPLMRVADEAHIASMALTTKVAAVFAISGGLLSGGVSFKSFRLSLFNAVLLDGPELISNRNVQIDVPYVIGGPYGAQFWQHVGNHSEVANKIDSAVVSVTGANATIVVRPVVAGGSSFPATATTRTTVDMHTMLPLFFISDASVASATLSLKSSMAVVRGSSTSSPNTVVLMQVMNVSIIDTAWLLSNTQFLATGNGGVIFDSAITWGENTTVSLACGTVWNGRSLRPRTINVPNVVLKRSELRRRASRFDCDGEQQVMYSFSQTLEVTPSHRNAVGPRSGALTMATIGVASVVSALLPSVATVVPGIQMVSQLSAMRRMCAVVAAGDGVPPPPLSDAASDPLQVAITSFGAELMYAGGSVVSSLVLWMVFIVVALVALVVRGRAEWLAMARVSSVAVALRLPGSLYAPTMLVVQPLVTASVVLVASSARSGGSAALGVVVLLMTVAPLSIVVARIWRGRMLSLLRWRVKKKHGKQMNSSDARTFASYLLEDRFECAPHGGRESLQHFERYGSVAASFVGEREWFVGVEVLTAVAGGVLSGVALGLDPSVGCTAGVQDGVDLSQAALLCGVLLAVAVLRPYASRFGNVLSGVSLLLSALCLVLQVLAPDTSNGAVSAMTWAQVVLGILPLLWLPMKATVPFRPPWQLDTVGPLTVRNDLFEETVVLRDLNVKGRLAEATLEWWTPPSVLASPCPRASGALPADAEVCSNLMLLVQEICSPARRSGSAIKHRHDLKAL